MTLKALRRTLSPTAAVTRVDGQGQPAVGRRLVSRIAVSVLFAGGGILMAGAASLAKFPEQLQGTWDIGPGSCRLPVNPDSDTPIRIESARLVGYENIDIPTHVSRLSQRPEVWLIASQSNIAPAIDLDEVYVLNGDYLTITDGEVARSYSRCR